jgi:hypothetical protein
MANDFNLGPPFAFVGAVALLLACLGSPAHDVFVGALLPLFLYFIGRRHSRTGDYAVTFVLLGLVSWFNGTFLLAPLSLRSGMCGHPLAIVFAGMALGFLAYLPLVIPLCIFMAAAKRAREARPGSVVAAAEHRFIWAVGVLPFVWLTGVVAFGFTIIESPTWKSSLILAAAIGVQLAFFVADALTLRRISRCAALKGPKLSAPIEYTTRVDLGVGHELYGRITTPATYRQAPQASVVLAGDPTRSAAAVRACMRSYAQCLCALYAVPCVITLLMLLANRLR